MAPINAIKAKIIAPEAKRWHFGIATCSDNHRLKISLENSNCKSISHLSWLVGSGPDCYYMYQHLIVWQGERCFTALKDAVLDAAFGRGPEPHQIPEIEEITAEEAVNCALNFPHKRNGAYTSLAQIGLPESIRDAPGVRGYASTYCARWTSETPMYREYISDGFREPVSKQVMYYGQMHNFATPPSREEPYRYRHKDDVLTWAVYFTPGLIRAIACLNEEVA